MTCPSARAVARVFFLTGLVLKVLQKFFKNSNFPLVLSASIASMSECFKLSFFFEDLSTNSTESSSM